MSDSFLKALGAVFLLAACRLALPAAEFESRHGFDFVTLQNEKFDLTFHTQFRTRSHFNDVSQFRTGPIARYAVLPHVRLVGGYYYRDLHDAGEDWRDTHRVFFGMENPFSHGRIGIQSRASLERYFGADSAPYNRFRHRMRVSWERAVAPYAFVEYYVLARRYQGIRYAAGLQRGLWSGVQLDIAYYFDNYRLEADRHSLATTLRFNLGRAR